MNIASLASFLNRIISYKTPESIELCLPDATLVLPPTAESVVDELTRRRMYEVELLKCDTIYLVEHDFEFALTVKVK